MDGPHILQETHSRRGRFGSNALPLFDRGLWHYLAWKAQLALESLYLETLAMILLDFKRTVPL